MQAVQTERVERWVVETVTAMNKGILAGEFQVVSAKVLAGMFNKKFNAGEDPGPNAITEDAMAEVLREMPEIKTKRDRGGELYVIGYEPPQKGMER